MRSRSEATWFRSGTRRRAATGAGGSGPALTAAKWPGSGSRWPPALGLLACLALAACAPGLLGKERSPFFRQYEAGRYHEAVGTFLGDTTLQDDEEALYRMGLLHASPENPYYAPDRSRELLRRLLALHPETEHRRAVEHVLGILDEVESLSQRVVELQTQLERLKAVDLQGLPPDTGALR